ncbi:MAG: SUMF1/EgtB/PvdO family nonheme iron enzyme [Phycisphaerales bacterium]|nr:SUMF1/EgtB/PvdO family nonheme iron enzyme [Phycisphaerales bacterium]
MSTPFELRRQAPRSSVGIAWPTLGGAFLVLVAIGAGAPDDAPTTTAPPAAPAQTAPNEVVEIPIPGTTVTFRMVKVPSGHAPPPKPDAAPEEFGTFWMGETEVPWDVYDVFIYRLDEADPDPSGTGADATTRPSKPYVPPDRGFGHTGFPAMGMTHMAAERFCDWLSEKTGRRFRLPTEAEWEYACRAGSSGPYCFGDDAGELDEYAWFASNAERSTHATGGKQRNRFGLADVHGNVAEWVNGRDGKPIAKGGSYKDGPDGLAVTARLKQRSSWNASDPQIPKSKWWLADCSFVGFRLVMEDGPGATDKTE